MGVGREREYQSAESIEIMIIVGRITRDERWKQKERRERGRETERDRETERERDRETESTGALKATRS